MKKRLRKKLHKAEYQQYGISIIVSVMLSIAKEPTALSDCLVGFFINPAGNEISDDATNQVNTELEKTLNADFKINRKIGLWK